MGNQEGESQVLAGRPRCTGSRFTCHGCDARCGDRKVEQQFVSDFVGIYHQPTPNIPGQLLSLGVAFSERQFGFKNRDFSGAQRLGINPGLQPSDVRRN